MASPYFGTVPLDAALPRGALVSDGDFVRSEFYNEILRPARGFHGVGALLRGPGPLMASINICRPAYAGAYDAPDAAALQTLLPHIAMALEVQARMTAASDRSRSLEGLLDRFAVAALVSDPSARPSFLNARAETLLAAADGLALSPAGLVAATPDADPRAARRHRPRRGQQRRRPDRGHPAPVAAPLAAAGPARHAHAGLASRSGWRPAAWPCW